MASIDPKIAAQIKQFNKRFYTSFDTQYFIQKCLYLLTLMQNPNLIETPLLEGIEIGKLKISLSAEELKEAFPASFVTNLRSEIALTYFHAVETLFRLLIAHSQASECPWIDLTEITEFRKFKADVAKIVSHTYYKSQHEQSLAAVFYGRKKKPENVELDKWSRGCNNLSGFIDIFGTDLLDSRTYNTYKHGSALFTEDFGFSLGEVIKVEKDDAFVALNNERDRERPGYRKLSTSYSYTFWQRRTAFVQVITLLLQNLINVGKARYLENNAVEFHLLDYIDPLKLVVDEDHPIQPSNVKISSFSYRKD